MQPQHIGALVVTWAVPLGPSDPYGRPCAGLMRSALPFPEQIVEIPGSSPISTGSRAEWELQGPSAIAAAATAALAGIARALPPSPEEEEADGEEEAARAREGTQGPAEGGEPAAKRAVGETRAARADPMEEDGPAAAPPPPRAVAAVGSSPALARGAVAAVGEDMGPGTPTRDEPVACSPAAAKADARARAEEGEGEAMEGLEPLLPAADEADLSTPPPGASRRRTAVPLYRCTARPWPCRSAIVRTQAAALLLTCVPDLRMLPR
jgi:hypothetical protein